MAVEKSCVLFGDVLRDPEIVQRLRERGLVSPFPLGRALIPSKSQVSCSLLFSSQKKDNPQLQFSSSAQGGSGNQKMGGTELLWVPEWKQSPDTFAWEHFCCLWSSRNASLRTRVVSLRVCDEMCGTGRGSLAKPFGRSCEGLKSSKLLPQGEPKTSPWLQFRTVFIAGGLGTGQEEQSSGAAEMQSSGSATSWPRGPRRGSHPQQNPLPRVGKGQMMLPAAKSCTMEPGSWSTALPGQGIPPCPTSPTQCACGTQLQPHGVGYGLHQPCNTQTLWIALHLSPKPSIPFKKTSRFCTGAVCQRNPLQGSPVRKTRPSGCGSPPTP